ncbi:hypothetical protein MKX01_019192 [Papaver californicum]|nr:hypothetical protein MKX01_019192 [Papaver californicum]
MNSNQQKKINYGGGGEKEMLHELTKKQGQQLPTITSSPPSSTTSPSHEFSFTISLHSSSNEKTITKSKSKTPATTTLSPPHNSFAIDLSPADDIFFHGHLLPLHLLSHLPISPRSSTNSLDSFTLPIKELQDDNYNKKPTTNTNTTITTSNNNTYTMSSNNIYTRENNGRIKAKSFSFLKFPRRQKGSEFEEREKEMEKKKKKTGFNMIQIIRRYAKMVRPLLFYKNGSGKTSTTTTRRETATGHFDFEREPYSSFSGNLSLGGCDNNKKRESRGRRGEFSAPASMWTSPTNSGLLLTTPLGVHSSSSESSIEELQSAIQAAIAHCKNSSTPIKEGGNKLQS